MIGNFAPIGCKPMPISSIYLYEFSRGETPRQILSEKYRFRPKLLASGLLDDNGPDIRGISLEAGRRSGVERIIGLIYEETRGGGSRLPPRWVV